MTKLSKLVFFGTEDFSAPSLEMLLDRGWPVAAVITKPDSPAGRGRKITPPKVKLIAQEAGVKVLQPAKVTEVNDTVKQLKPDLGVLVAYGKIIPQSTIDLFPGGIVNVHPSLLPKYRGAAPIEAAILNGDKETGVSLMKLTAGMDEGPIYKQEPVGLTGTEDKPTLYKKLAGIGAGMLDDNLDDIAAGSLEPIKQLDSAATYTKLLKKDDGLIDWTSSATDYERQVRAYLGWPKSRAKIHGQEVVITKARVADSESDGQLVISCDPGFLEILELTAPSGRSMSGADFIRGYAAG